MIAKNKILIIIIGFLLITNIGMLVFLLNKTPSNKPNQAATRSGGFAETLQKDIGFGEEQLKVYQELREKQRAEMKVLFQQLRQSKDSFYNHLYRDPVNADFLDSIASPIGDRQIEVDKKVFTYFTSIRNLCTPEQVSKFDSVLPNIVSRMTGGVRKDHNRNAEKPKE